MNYKIIRIDGKEDDFVANLQNLMQDTNEKILLESAKNANEQLASSIKETAATLAQTKAELKAARNAVIDSLIDGKDEEEAAAITGEAKGAWEKLIRKVMRSTVISEGKRIDGRATDEIRDIWCELGIAPRAHGSPRARARAYRAPQSRRHAPHA